MRGGWLKIDATIFLVKSYSSIHVEVDENIDLKDFMEIAGMNGHVLCEPRFFLLKGEKPLEGNENGFFVAIRLPEKKGGSVPE